MSQITLPYTYQTGQVIVAGNEMANLNAIVNVVNGNIDNTNLSNTLAISDSHLNQITSAGKVNGTALTGLASIPSGAGVIPTANLPVNIFSPVILAAHSTTTQTITGLTQRTGFSVDEDSGGYFSSNTYTPLVSGWYLVSYTDGQTGANGSVIAASIYKNGSNYVTNSIGANSSNNSGPTVTAIVQMNGSSDYLTFYMNNNGSSYSASGAGFNYLSIVRVF